MRKRSVFFPKICKQVRSSGVMDAFVNLPVPVAAGQKTRYERHYLGPFGSTEAATQYARLKELWQRNNGGVTSKREILSIAGMCREFMAYCRSNYAPTSYEPEKYFRSLSQLIDFCGPESAESFGLLRLEQFRTSLISSDRYCRKEINQRIWRVKAAFDRAAQRKLIPVTVAAEVRLLKPIQRGRYRDNPPVPPVPMEHVLATLPFLSSPVAAMIRLQLLTGCRPEEIRIMRPCDIDRELKNDCWRYTPEHHKTQRFNEAKIIPLKKRAFPTGFPISYAIHPPQKCENDSVWKRRKHCSAIKTRPPRSFTSSRTSPKPKNWPEKSRICFKMGSM